MSGRACRDDSRRYRRDGGAAGAGAPSPPDAFHPQRGVRPGRETAARARSRRGRLRVRRRRQPLLRRAVLAVLLPDRLLVRRGDGGGRLLQLSTLAFNTNWATAHPPAIRLATALADRAPGDLNRVFFTNGGSESVEAAWKIVRQHYLGKGEPQRTKAIARETAYHGVTLGALSFTGVRPYKEPFGAAPIPVVRVSNTNRVPRPGRPATSAALCARLLDEMERTIVEAGPETVAMVIAEPVQNAGGCLVPPEGYWPGLRALCDRYGDRAGGATR